MADHLRNQIRDVAFAAVTGLTTTGDRVFKSRVYPLDKYDLPGLTVFTKVEESVVETIGEGTRTLFRTLELMIQAYVQTSLESDDEMDLVLAEVETAVMAADYSAMFNQEDIELTTTDIGFVSETDHSVSIGTLTFTIFYRAVDGDPTTNETPGTGGLGLVWEEQISGTSEHLWGIHGIGDAIRIASGDNNVVARTINGGQNWGIATTQIGFWENVHCRSNGVCLLVGWKPAGGAADNLKRSVDSGATWSPVNSGSPDDLYEALYEPSTDAWLIGSLALTTGPHLRRSTDGGLAWQEATHTFDNDILAMADDGAGTVIAVGENGLNGYSTDGGVNWIQNPNLSGSIQDCAHDPVTGNFVGVTGTSNLYYSTDGGRTWQLATNPTANAGSFRGAYFNGLGIGIVVGQHRTILRTVDGGVTYTVINETLNDTELLAVFHDGVTWHSCGRSGLIIKAA